MGITVLDKTARIIRSRQSPEMLRYNPAGHSDSSSVSVYFDNVHKSHPDVSNHTCPPILASSKMAKNVP